MVDKPRPFITAFARKLLTFALGRRLGPQDEASIALIVDAAQQHDCHIQEMIEAVLVSDSFCMH